MESTLEALYRGAAEVARLIRFEEDDWRVAEQDEAKVWSVSTAWGADAAARLGAFLRAHDHSEDADSLLERAVDLYESLLPNGPFCTATGLLAEQVFDDGTFDCATPLGWSHVLRLHATALLEELDALPPVAVHPGPE